MAAFNDRTEMEVANQATKGDGEVVIPEQFNTFIELFEAIGGAGPNDEDAKTTLIDFSKFLGAFYDTIIGGMKEEELKRYTSMVSDMSSKYKYKPELLQQINEWCEWRKQLIVITNAAANELDQNSKIVYIARIIGSCTDILGSFNLEIFQELHSIIVSSTNDILPSLGPIIQWGLPLVPYLSYMGIVSCFFEGLRSEVLLQRVVAAMKRDRHLFEPLRKWFDETDEFEESVKKLFPYQIDKVIVMFIDEALKDLGEERKIFAAAVMSNIKRDPSLYKNKKLLTKIVLFCRSKAAKEWYNRIVADVRPSDLESSLFFFKIQLQYLESIDSHLDSKIEGGKCCTQVSILPRLILWCMNGMNVYYCYKKIQAGSKHRCSSGLRELVKNAQPFLNAMENIRKRNSSLLC